MTALCSAACVLDEPRAGAELAGGAITRTFRSSSPGSHNAMVGQAPMFAGSSCTQAISASAGYRSSSARISPRGSG